MSRFIRFGNAKVLDRTRVLGLRKGYSWTGKPVIKIQYFQDFKFDQSIVQPTWYWESFKYQTSEERDTVFELLAMEVQKNRDGLVMIEDWSSKDE